MLPTLLTLVAAPLASVVPATDKAHADWIPVQSISQGIHKPAELRYVPELSNEHTTTLELEIFGYYKETVVGPDGVAYERLSFPGLGELGDIGSPELPALRTRLAVATDAAEVQFLDASVNAADIHTAELLLYPEPLPGADDGDPDQGDPNGTPESFQIDPDVYAVGMLLPAVQAFVPEPVQPTFGGVPTATVELFPVRYNPADRKLQVNAKTTYTFRHEGDVQSFKPLNLDLAAVAEASCPNWPGAAPFIKSNYDSFANRYLIVTPEKFTDALQPFIQHRINTGFSVTLIELEDLPAVTCGEIRGAIDDWYQFGPSSSDHYCLLVGDIDELPMCSSPTPEQVPTDDLYGSPSGIGDLNEEIFVGRLSVDWPDDVTRQTQKIMDYELDDNPNHDYSDVVLVAHREDAPGKYVGAHEEVANFPYASPLSFEKLYGNDLFVNNDDVSAAVDFNLGLVAYRGHGTNNRWSDWNAYGEDFSTGDVGDLENEQLPVVWSFSCTNGALDFWDGIGEVWMKIEHGAVAHYGSTRVSGTTKNHTLDKKMFEAVFDKGLTTQGQAIAWAEDQVRLLHPNNAYQNEWMYTLLGCPAMKVRRGAAKGLGIAAPSELPGGDSSEEHYYTINLTNATVAPIQNAQVTVVEDLIGSQAKSEAIKVVYTVQSEDHSFLVPKGLGEVIVTARDNDGNVVQETIPLRAGAFVSLGDALAGTEGLEPALVS